MKNTSHTALFVAAALLITEGFAAASSKSPGPMPPPDNQKLAHDIFKQIVEVRSIHGVGTRRVADILVRYLMAAGFTDGAIHVLAEEKYPNQVNVVVRLTGKGKARPILWNGHMDVVEAKPQYLSLPPFQFIEKDPVIPFLLARPGYRVTASVAVGMTFTISMCMAAMSATKSVISTPALNSPTD